MDIDLLRRGIADQRTLVQLVEQCATISDPSDGVIFEPTMISVEQIRDATEYVGTRIRLLARLDNVRQTVQIDFGVGDAVHPEPQIIDYPVLLTGPPVRLNGYPVEAAIAEKFQAMVHLDLQNSRMKDFYDIWILSRTLTFSGPTLSQAIRSTFNRRQTDVPVAPPPALTAEFYSGPTHVQQWAAFVRRIGEPALANEFSQVVSTWLSSICVEISHGDGGAKISMCGPIACYPCLADVLYIGVFVWAPNFCTPFAKYRH
jgi:hypothetical protein